MVNTSVKALNIAVNESRRALMSYKEDVKESFTPPSEIITEGWAMLIHFLNIPLTVISIDNVDRIIHNPKVEKYIESQCKEILAEEKKRDRSVTKEMPSGLLNAMAISYEGDRRHFFSNRSITFLLFS